MGKTLTTIWYTVVINNIALLRSISGWGSINNEAFREL